ncbi:MAG TPA: PIN domain-containing protein [Thermoplasmata archaeon]|nr:PIN domain-containing protein [Thermoplasmata archaeon]
MKVFVDTWALKALFDTSDSDHKAASIYRESIRKDEVEVSGFITTDFILDETLTLVRSHAGHRESIAVLDSVRGSPFYKILDVDGEIFEGAIEMFRKYDDKEWSFTDCTSFVLMRREGLTEAFTFDRNFEQAGFTRVPMVAREPPESRLKPSSSAPRAPAASPRRGTPATPRRPSRRGRIPTRS